MPFFSPSSRMQGGAPRRSRAAVAGARLYRRPSPHADERSFQVVVEQSDLWITVERNHGDADLEEIALSRLQEVRAQISAWIQLVPDFGASLTPLAVPDHAPQVVRRMCEAAAVMGVGPMAAVAGAVALCVAEALLPHSANCIVENGGDSMLFSTRDRVVALLPDPAARARLGLRFSAVDFPLALCSSSATFGHSLSFGKGELAVVRSRDAFLADAAATAFCNMLTRPEDAGRVAELAADYASKGIDGVFLQCQGSIGIWGSMELTVL